MNSKKLYRLYREEKLVAHQRGSRKRAPMVLLHAINQRWSLYFVPPWAIDRVAWHCQPRKS